eukprot:8614371-Pyramimonas_sp.AAC.2
MAEADRQVRDELQRLPISAKDSRARGGRIITLRAMAICIWRNDIYTAQKLKATAADGARFLHVSDGAVELLDRQEFALIAHAANYEFGQMEARFAESRASKGEGA